MARISRFWLWCAGVDPQHINFRSEQIKHTCSGAMVLIPATLAFIAASYAVWTRDPRLTVFLPAGVFAFVVIFIFDRTIVATFRKADSHWKDLRSTLFLIRLVLSGTIGLGISGPMVQFFFQDDINRQLDDEKEEQLQIIDSRYKLIMDARKSEIRELHEELERLETARKRAQELYIAERAGWHIPGVTTGIRHHGPIAEQRQQEVLAIDEKIGKSRTHAEEREKQLRAEIDDLENSRQRERARYFQPRDYSARSRALAAISSKSPAVARVHAFFIFLFIFIDTLPILFKAATARGPYDDTLQTTEFKAAMKLQAEREAIQNIRPALVTAHQHELLARQAYESARLYTDAFSDLLHHLRKNRVVFLNEIETIANEASAMKNERAANWFQVRHIDDLVDTFIGITSRTLTDFRNAVGLPLGRD